MASRKFAVGDRVRLSFGASSDPNPQDVYAIVRAIPAEANVWQYRVRGEGDGQEQAVSEAQLVSVAPERLIERNRTEAQLERQPVRNANAMGRGRSAARRY
jgi:hypothetical protein